MSATLDSRISSAQHFERLCAAPDTDSGLLLAATLEALGEGWSARYSRFNDRWSIDHKSGRVRIVITDGEFSVQDFDRFGFDLGDTIFRGDRRYQGPRALRYATNLAAHPEG